MRRIHLIRHAESVWNRERKVQGTTPNVPLSETGRLQAGRLGVRLLGMDFDAVYSSDAERAIETARIALGDERPIILRRDIIELSLGDWEGRPLSEIGRLHPEELKRWYVKPSTVRIDGGEDLDSFRKKSSEAIEEIIELSGDGDVLIFTHGGVICCYLTHLFGMSVDDLWCFSVPNASITTIVMDFRPRLRFLGDTSHLDGDSLGLDGMPSAL